MFTAKDFEVARAIKPGINLARLDPSAYAWLKIAQNANSGSTIYNATIENGIATFGGVVVSKPLVSLLLNIPVKQTGSGTPSPDNIRDFIGVSGVNIGQTSGYGEYFRGLLNGTYGFVDLGSLTWQDISTATYLNRFMANISGVASSPDMVCLRYDYKGVGGYGTIINDDKSYSYNHVIGTLNFHDSSCSSSEDITNAVSGVYLIYELAEPSTPITPQDFATLCQAFGITGNTYTISFGQTVYSAILDVLTGKLYLTHEIKTIDENSGVVVSSTNNNVYICDDVFNIDEDTESVNCNVYQRAENRSSITGVVNNNPDLSFCCKLGANPTRLLIKDTRFTSTEDYNTWLSNNPVKIAVKLATPIEIDITPTVINTLIGENVIFADVADVTECKYTKK